MSKNLLESFNHALSGIFYTLRTQKNMRIHLLVTLCIIFLCFFLELSRVELAALAIIVTLVLMTEMINTVVETLLNVVSKEYNQLIQVTKDLAAGVVLLASACAVLIGYLILWPAIDLKRITFGVIKLREVPDSIIFGSLLLVGVVTIIIKICSRKGTPMYGGMPSGHAAVAFSLWTSIAFLTNQPIIVLLGFILAVLVTQNRLRAGIHTLWEVLGGAILGTFLTTLVFKICR